MKKNLSRWLSNRKLWQKLLILYLAVSMPPMVSLGIAAYVIPASILNHQVNARMQEYSNWVMRQIEDKRHFYETIVDNFAYSIDFLYTLNEAAARDDGQSVQAACAQIQTSAKFRSDEIEQVRIVIPKPAGESVFGTGGNSSDAYILTQLHRNPFDGHKLVYLDNQDQQTFLFRRIIDPYSGNTVGTVVFILHADAFFGTFSMANIPEYAFILHNNQGETIYTKAHLSRAFGSIYDKVLQRSRNGELRMMQNTFLFEPYKIPDLNWTIYLLLPKDVIFEGFSDILVISVLITAVCVLLVTVCSIFISLNLSHRLDGISKEMIRVGSGNLEVRLNEQETGDEIGRLAYIFREMVNKINMLIIDKYEIELKKQEAQLNILQAQINPHFLYNCMDTVNWRAIMNGDEKTSAFATNLSDFYRTCLNKGNPKTKISEEIRNIRAYLSLQLDLHDNSFDVFEDVDPQIFDYQCVTLILQPIVENAIVHGIERSKGRQYIRLEAGFKNGGDTKNIEFRIMNSGTSIKPEVAESILTHTTRGYGLVNVNNRIQLYFGKEYGIKIDPVPGGTLCCILIPAILFE